MRNRVVWIISKFLSALMASSGLSQLSQGWQPHLLQHLGPQRTWEYSQLGKREDAEGALMGYSRQIPGGQTQLPQGHWAGCPARGPSMAPPWPAGHWVAPEPLPEAS